MLKQFIVLLDGRGQYHAAPQRCWARTAARSLATETYTDPEAWIAYVSVEAEDVEQALEMARGATALGQFRLMDKEPQNDR